VVDPKYLDQIRTEAKHSKLLSRHSGIARSAIMNFKNGRNTIKLRTLRKLIKAIHALQNKNIETTVSSVQIACARRPAPRLSGR
jgi:predicted transcriptional regulator